jgi:hypothetical protein
VRLPRSCDRIKGRASRHRRCRRILGAKLGANDHSYQATPGHFQPLRLQLDGTSGHTWRYPATLRKCLLSSRFRVRVAVGAQVRGGVTPRRVSLGAKLGAGSQLGSQLGYPGQPVNRPRCGSPGGGRRSEAGARCVQDDVTCLLLLGHADLHVLVRAPSRRCQVTALRSPGSPDAVPVIFRRPALMVAQCQDLDRRRWGLWRTWTD